MAGRATELAARYGEVNDELVASIEGCSDAQWQHLSAEEGWTVAAVAHHVAEVQVAFARMVEQLAGGETFSPNISMDVIHAGNARHAREFATAGRLETLDLQRTTGATLLRLIEGLDDASLEHNAGVFGGNELTVGQVVEWVVIGHAAEHLASIPHHAGRVSGYTQLERRIQNGRDERPMATPPGSAGNYASVNGLDLYYEVHGSGPALVLLHGAFMTIEAFGPLLPALAATRQVIAVEQQAHGHTADVERPLSHAQMADDTAALLAQLGIADADVCGYSMGAITALHLAIRHPDLVRKLVFVSAGFNSGGYLPGVLDGIQAITPELFVGSPWHDAYLRVAPNPDGFATLVAKIKQLNGHRLGYSPENVRALAAPTLAIFGDSDGIQPEHMVELFRLRGGGLFRLRGGGLFRLRGGGVFGDMVGLPASRLAVLPGTTHVGLLQRVDWLVPMITEFLDAPLPAGG